MINQKTENMLFRCIVIIMLAAFIASANLPQFAADFASGSYSGVLNRGGLIVLVAAVLGLLISGRLLAASERRPAHLLLIIFFCGVLLYPILSHTSYMTKSFEKVSDYLRREQKKTSASTLDVIKKFPGTYEKFWKDKSILSKSFIHLNALVKIYMFKISPNTRVAVGKEGFFFEGYGARKVEKGIVEKFDNIADYMGLFPFSQLDLWKWKQTLEERSYWLKKQGMEYVFVLAPTKALVYPEFLPQSLQNIKKGTRRYGQLTSYLRKHAQVHFVDLLPVLLKEKKKRDYPLLFYKTDFHWNFYGSLVAYQEIINKMASFFPDFTLNPVTLDDFTLNIDTHWAHHRFMNMIGLPEQLHKNEHYLTMVPKPGTPLYGLADLPPEGIHDVYPPKGKISNNQGKSMQISMVRNPAAPVPSILLFGDSFMEKTVYYFSANAQKVLNYRTIVNFPHKIFSYEKPTIVIQEILNMFLLRPPPENPSGIRQSYLKSLFLSAPPVTGKTQDDATGKPFSMKWRTENRWPVHKWRNNHTGYIAKITLVSERNAQLDILLRFPDGKETPWAKERISTPNAALYIAVPPDAQVKELVFHWKKESGKGMIVKDVEFRKLIQQKKTE
ncbi:MAG: hypothetical protein D3924_01425 [Candidatus Electrothrix sp. AR4]|nr:hypothetical protein [Candidatus Electrothrix sp. AR4]